MLKIKDQELSRLLDELTDGDLTRALKNHRAVIVSYQKTIHIPLHLRGATLWVEISKADTDLTNPYSENFSESFDPDTWNLYPDVLPPDNVPMRVEVFDGGRIRWRGFGIFKDGKWKMDTDLRSGEGLRYRMWNDPYEKNVT